MTLVNLTSLSFSAASDAGTGIFETSASSSTRPNSSAFVSLPIAARTEPENLYGLAVDAITVFVLSPVAAA